MLATLVPLSLATALMATNQTVLVLEDERIEVIFLDEAPKAAPGPPIAAPPGPQVQPQQQEQQTPPPEREPEPEPVEPDDVQDDLPADAPPLDDGAVVAQLDLPPGGGGGGGCEGDDCDDEATCVGEHCSPDGPIVRQVHWSAVSVRRKVEPRMPAAARSLGPMSVKCTIRMSIDERGRVTDVLPVDCPPLFHESAQVAAAKWRFDPMEVDGNAVPASFLLTIRYEVN